MFYVETKSRPEALHIEKPLFQFKVDVILQLVEGFFWLTGKDQ